MSLDRSMGGHIPPGARRRNGGRHTTLPRTSLIGGPDAGAPDPADAYSAYAGGPDAYSADAGGPDPYSAYASGPDPYSAYASGPDPYSAYADGPRAYASYPAGPRSGQAGTPRAYAPEPAYAPDPAAAGGAEDTLVLGRMGAPRDRRPSRWPPAGGAGRLAVAMCGVAIVAFAGFRMVPPVLQHLGIGTPAPGPGPCATCLGPIPSSSPLPQAPSAAPSTAPARAAPPIRRTPAAVTMPSTPAPSTSAAAPTSPGAPPGVTYQATEAADGGFTGQVTVVNHGTAPISNWQLVVALPLDSVSAVHNADFSYDSDVVFASPAPGDPPISPGGTLVVTIYGSGPTTAPADCYFNHVACQ